MKTYKHNLSGTKLLSGRMGYLYPIGLCEVLPGDTFQHSVNALLRATPLLSPVMHTCHVRIHHFFVPTRLVWEDWEAFITGGEDGEGDGAVYPTQSFDGTPFPAVTQGQLMQHLGVPTGFNRDTSALPQRVYTTIWNEYFRDQDIQAKATVSKASGADTTTNNLLLPVSWEKDYFTTARPWEQKGPTVTIPMAGNATVQLVPHTENTDGMVLKNRSTGAALTGTATGNAGELEVGGVDAVLDPNGRLRALLSTATGADVNDLREAFALLRWQEARGYFGSRYTEYLRFYGIRSSDARLQRPEYLGGGRQVIQFSEVLQTGVSVDSADEPLGEVGDLKGHGIAALRSNKYRRFFEEHGYVMTVLSVRPRAGYMQQMNRMWHRRTNMDYYTPELARIGKQAITNEEIQALSSSPTGVFGYQDRYDDYRCSPFNQVSGMFANELDYWNMFRDFGTTTPVLNSAFLDVAQSVTDRIFAVPSEDTMLIQANHKLIARRQVIPSSGIGKVK